MTAMNSINCNGFAGATKLSSSENIIEHYVADTCVHQVLTKLLTYTALKSKSHNFITHGQAYSAYFVCTENFEIGKLERWQYIPHATQFSSYYFIHIVEQPAFDAQVLLKPFTWASWISIIACGLALLCVTKAAYFCMKKHFRNLWHLKHQKIILILV